jgi:hypothetical protein
MDWDFEQGLPPRYELAAWAAGYNNWKEWADYLPQEAFLAKQVFNVEGEVVDDNKEEK